MKGKRIAFFGSSLVSAYWNGAATYYRGIIKALHQKGYHITFFEPDAYERQQNRDMSDPEWAKVVVYQATETGVLKALGAARDADLIIKASGVGVFDELLEAAVIDLKRKGQLVVFWDVDAPATLERLKLDPADPFRELIPQYDMILTYGGGEPVVKAYQSFGAQSCHPIYNALDPDTHHPSDPVPEYQSDLAFLGNRLPDREKRVGEFFINVAAAMPGKQFLLGGSGWADKPLTENVLYTGHVSTNMHNPFNCTPVAVLNISRDSMATYGFSPATRVFEAAGAGACIITDYWLGIEEFFEPGKEILVARNGDEVKGIVSGLTKQEAKAIGKAALRRVLANHTYYHRARELNMILKEKLYGKSVAV